mgnify:CR=1 FL=1
MILLNNISKSFSDKSFKKVLSEINIKIESGKIYSFYGPNGSGKTTLFKIISGLIIQDYGSITFKNDKSNICYVASNPRAFVNRISAYENLEYFFTARTGKKLFFNERLKLIAEKLGIFHLLDSNVSSFSTGEIQKLSILRSMTYEPDILIFDETFASIDQESANNLFEILEEEIEMNNLINVLLSSHEFGFLEKYSEKIIHMKDINCV